MKSLIDSLLDGKKELMEKFGSHSLKVEKEHAQKRVEALREGIVPDFDKDSELEYIKKLTETVSVYSDSKKKIPNVRESVKQFFDRRREGKDKTYLTAFIESRFAPSSLEEQLKKILEYDKGEDRIYPEEEEDTKVPPRADAPPEEEEDEEPEDEEIEKEYLGKKDETYFYITKGDGEDMEGEERGNLQVVDQEGKIVFPTEDDDVDTSDKFHFLVDAVRALQPEVSYDIFIKYVVPKIEELEKEEGDYTDEEPSEEEDYGDQERPRESKDTSLHEIKITFDRREFNVNLVDESGPGTVIEINGKRFNFSQSFSNMYKDDDGKISEDKLEELASNALSEMDKDEFDDLVVKGPEHAGHKDPKEGCGAKHKKEKVDESEDMSKDVKELQKSAEQAIKDSDFTQAAELCQRLSIVQQAIGDVGSEEEAVEAEEETPPPVDDEEVDLEDEDEELSDDDEEEFEEGIVPKPGDGEKETIEKLEEKDAPTCSKCNSAHWPFHKCKSAGDGDKKDDKKDDEKEEKPAEDDKKDDEKEKADEGMCDQLKKTEEEAKKKVGAKEGIEPDMDKDSEEEAIKKLTEMCDKCDKEPCICNEAEEDDPDVLPRRPKKRREF